MVSVVTRPLEAGGRAYRFAATGAIRCVVVATGRLKMRDMKIRDQIAGVENAGKVSMESQSVKKCLKVVVFVCRVIPSV